MNQIKSLIKHKESIILFIIVIVDLITKLIANCFLPFKERVCIIGEKLCLYLTYNQGSTGGQADFLLQSYHNKNLAIVLSCFLVFALLGYMLFIRKHKMNTFYKILIGTGLFLILGIIMELILPLLESINISPWTTSVVGKLTALLIIYCIIFYSHLEKWIRLSLVILFAAGIGNLLGHFYPPYYIIDFIYVEGSYDLIKVGVFNIADLTFYIGILGLVASTLFYELKKRLFRPNAKPL